MYPPVLGSFTEHTPVDDIQCLTRCKIINLADKLSPKKFDPYPTPPVHR